MKTIIFKPEFQQKILSGIKDQTIRPLRKRPLKIGEPVSFRCWSGSPYRSNQIEFARAEITDVLRFTMERLGKGGPVVYMCNGVKIDEQFIRRDGFDNRVQFETFFGSYFLLLPFNGDVYRWKLER